MKIHEKNFIFNSSKKYLFRSFFLFIMKKLHSVLSIGLLLSICFASGCKNEEVTSSEIEDYTSITDPDLQNYTAIPLHSELTEAQPMTGIVLWIDQAKKMNSKYGKSISLEYAYCLPCKVVKGKTTGKIDYDWSSFETLLEDIASRNHQAVIRFRYEYPSGTDVDGKLGTTAVPDYIKALSDYKETYAANPGGDGQTYYADWSNSELQWFTKQFYTDFAARYDNDPRLAFLEVGFGHWSEYHIYGTTLKLGDNFPSHAFQEEFLNHVDSMFEQLPWMLSIDASDNEYSPIASNSNLMALNFGLFDDSFMHSEHDFSQGEGYNEECWNIIGTNNRWSKAPCGGEISYYSSSDQANFLNPDGMYGVTWEQAAAKYHISFMIGNDAPGTTYGTPERFLEASLASGYKYRIEEFWTSADSAKVKIANVGIAPIYRDAYVSVNGVRGNYSLKALQPGESCWVGIASGGTQPTLSIECDHLVGRKIGYEADYQP